MYLSITTRTAIATWQTLTGNLPHKVEVKKRKDLLANKNVLVFGYGKFQIPPEVEVGPALGRFVSQGKITLTRLELFLGEERLGGDGYAYGVSVVGLRFGPVFMRDGESPEDVRRACLAAEAALLPFLDRKIEDLEELGVCGECAGTGQMWEYAQDGLTPTRLVVCEDCQGGGKVPAGYILA